MWWLTHCPGCLGGKCETSESMWVALMQSLPLVYSSLEEHQKQDPFCIGVSDKLRTGNGGVEVFQWYKGLVCYSPKGLEPGGGWCRCR
jgi:hypothetical protein